MILERYVSAVKKLKKIKMTIHNGYSIAGFMKEAEAGNLTNGNHVIILNDGNLSLHVDRDNKRAIKVYEKMGFKQSYIRMIHK